MLLFLTSTPYPPTLLHHTLFKSSTLIEDNYIILLSHENSISSPLYIIITLTSLSFITLCIKTHQISGYSQSHHLQILHLIPSFIMKLIHFDVSTPYIFFNPYSSSPLYIHLFHTTNPFSHFFHHYQL